jgi:amino acid transporter
LIYRPFAAVICGVHAFSKDVFGGNGVHFLDTIAAPDWGLFVSTMLWSYTGWDCLGCIAGEVHDPSRTYIRGSMLTIVFVTVTYAVPVLAGVQKHPDVWTWDESSLLTFITEDVGKGLGWLATTASIASNFGLFQSTLTSSSRAIWALGGGDADSIMPCRHIPAIFGTTWKRACDACLLW